MTESCPTPRIARRASPCLTVTGLYGQAGRAVRSTLYPACLFWVDCNRRAASWRLRVGELPSVGQSWQFFFSAMGLSSAPAAPRLSLAGLDRWLGLRSYSCCQYTCFIFTGLFAYGRVRYFQYGSGYNVWVLICIIRKLTGY